MLKKYLAFAMLFAFAGHASGVEICGDADKNIAHFFVPGTWTIDHELSRAIFRNIEIPSPDPFNFMSQLRLIKDESEKVRNIFNSMPGCAYLLGRIEFPLAPSNNEELKEVFFAVTIEHGNLVVAIADNDQGYKTKLISIVAARNIRTNDKLFIEAPLGMMPFSRIVP